MNTQKPEGRLIGEGQTLDLHSVFYTIQGEGPYAGYPAIFIRLAGCNLQCPGCDTEYTEGRQQMDVGDILKEVERIRPPKFNGIYVLTGGEPFRQNITKLAQCLRFWGIVQVETNGTFNPPPYFPKEAWLVVSPKAPKFASEIWGWPVALKYVLDHRYIDPRDGLPTAILGRQDIAPARPPVNYKGRIYVNPMDTGDGEFNAMNNRAVAESALTHGYIAGVQMHKILRLP